MPIVSAQRKPLDPLRTVNSPVAPFVCHLRLEVGIASEHLPHPIVVGSSWVANRPEALAPGWRQVGESRRMKRFGVTATQGKRANPFGIKRLPADGEFRFLRVKLRMLRFDDCSCRSVLAIPFLALGDIKLEA